MRRRRYPRIKLEGTDLLRRAGVIYSQIINDLVMKVDEGKGEYPKGFFHTSTTTQTLPNYHDQMWSRDVGRGIQELCRLGLTEDAKLAVDYILSQKKSFGDHYGRVINWKYGEHETDGNVSVLMGFYSLWNYTGRNKDEGIRYLDKCWDVFLWFESLTKDSPYGWMLKSKSELSGNPETDYFIYALFPTYGAMVLCRAFAQMAGWCKEREKERQLTEWAENYQASLLEFLLSEGKNGSQVTKTEAGVWLNGIDERTGHAAEEGNFGPVFDISSWTRQLPFIQDFDWDGKTCAEEAIRKINQASYAYIQKNMSQGYFFRKYGFVSNTCFKGMGGRHDDTMAGYGQNYFTQAAFLQEDVNTYTKCLDGICRLAYDGDIVAPLTVDLNPWVMHECFTYENYELGLDHTFGRKGNEELFIMDNPGDEGNMVQSAETLKTFSMMGGVGAEGNRLFIQPRLPWECTCADILDFPVVNKEGKVCHISYTYKLERWRNRYELEIRGGESFEDCLVRLGPLPNVLCNEEELKKEWEIVRYHQASFAQRVIRIEGQKNVTVSLVNEK